MTMISGSVQKKPMPSSILGSATSLVLLSSPALYLLFAKGYRRLKHDRWALVRCHKYQWVRRSYQIGCLLHFCGRLQLEYSRLAQPEDKFGVYSGSGPVLQKILTEGPNTYQKKDSNTRQIQSLMDIICGDLVPTIHRRQTKNVSSLPSVPVSALVLDIGAGKALLTRAIYEALGRKVPVIALDTRRGEKGDEFYDPRLSSPLNLATLPAGNSRCSENDASFTRVVADVRDLHKSGSQIQSILKSSNCSDSGLICITKHLCGGATDSCIQAICASSSRLLNRQVGACCFAPCCHQKTKRHQYCNMPYLESLGLCQTHTGLRGGVQDNDWRNLGLFISISRAQELKDYEYKNKLFLKVLGFRLAKQIGRKARRILEEGRMRYLADHGFETRLVRYCDESITSDNLVIIATRNIQI